MIDEDRLKRREKKVDGNRFHQVERKMIAETVRKIKNGRGTVLEVGCGAGYLTRTYIAPNCAQVLATDMTKCFIKEETDSNIKFQLEDALNLSFPDNSFDGVVSVHVIEHVEDDVRFIEEGLRVLRKGGTLFFVTPNRLRLTSVMRYLISKPIKFPHSYGKDAVLGNILHLREYSLGDLHKLCKKFFVDSVEIKGIWFGVPCLEIGMVHPPKFLKRCSFDWHIKMIKR